MATVETTAELTGLSLAQRAEIIKLARLCRVDDASLAWLGKLDAPLIRALREQATAAMFDADRKRFHNMATASRLLPIPILVLIIEKVIGPLICARVCGLVPAARAIEIAEKLKLPFLVDACIELDPRSAEALIAGFPKHLIVGIARELAKRGEYVTMGRFIDLIALDAIRPVVDAISDDAKLLHIAFFAESTERLGDIVERIPPQRLSDVVLHAATGSSELWAEALALIFGIDGALQQKLASITGELPEAALNNIVRNTQAIGRWDVLLPIVARMTPALQKRVINLPVIQDNAILADIIRAVFRLADIRPVILLLAHLDPDARAKLDSVARQLGLSLPDPALLAPLIDGR